MGNASKVKRSKGSPCLSSSLGNEANVKIDQNILADYVYGL
jgi:hypothetical protein